MRVDTKTAIENLEKQILARVELNERANLAQLLTNIRLFIKRVSGVPLTKQEKAYPSHILFSHHTHIGSQDEVNSFLRRLELINRYKINESQRIISILLCEFPVKKKVALTTRKAQILHILYQNPQTPKYQIAKKLGTTSRVVSKELDELQHFFNYQIYTSLDPQKFRLNYQIILFETKSIQHSERLEKLLYQQRGFLRAFQLDWDRRHGIIAYRFPDQREGHKMFEQRIRWLQDEFFLNAFVIRVEGHYYYMSFTNYDPSRNAFLLEPDVVSEVLLQFVKRHRRTIPSPKGFTYSKPIEFDQIDYLLAQMLFSTGETANIDYRRNVLKYYGFKLSPKTIWKREQRLRQLKAGYPIVDLQIPGCDEQNELTIWCPPETLETLMTFPSILPYAFMYTTNIGLMLFFQRPSFGSSITSQLIRSLHQEKDVIDIQLLQYRWRFTPPSVLDIVSRWDSTQQSWILEEGDI